VRRVGEAAAERVGAARAGAAEAAEPPAIPMATDSPITWPTTRRDFQPSAFSVPNSRTRRVTADIVSVTSADAAVTVITSPMPSARPTAMKMAWRARRRSSRQRYVKNIRLLNGQHEFRGTAGPWQATLAARYRRFRGSASNP
jgi:hypothetical protein